MTTLDETNNKRLLDDSYVISWRITLTIAETLIKPCKIDSEVSGVMIRESDYHATGPEFGYELGKVHLAFHLFRVDKMSIKFVWEVNTDGPAISSSPDWGTCYIVPRRTGSRKLGWEL